MRRWVHKSWRWERGALRRRDDDGDDDLVLAVAVASSVSHLSSVCKSCWEGLSSCWCIQESPICCMDWEACCCQEMKSEREVEWSGGLSQSGGSGGDEDEDCWWVAGVVCRVLLGVHL